MSDPVIVAVISGVLTLAGTCVTVWASNRKTTRAYETTMAVIEERVERLTEEVRKHNNFAERVPVLEEHMKSTDFRLQNLEKKG